MYILLYKIHKVVILLLLAIYAVKALLLILNQEERLQRFNAIFKIPSMLVGVLVAATGVGMLFEIAEIRTLFLIKVVIVVLSIPLAIYAFKKKMKGLAGAFVVLLIVAYGMAEVNKRQMVSRLQLPKEIITDLSNPAYEPVVHGQALYNLHCINCHGQDGRRGLSGAYDLTISRIPRDVVKYVLVNGRSAMPSYHPDFSNEEIEAMTEYVMKMRY